MSILKRSGLLTVLLGLGVAAAAGAAGLTPLQKAINKGDLKKVQELLDKGAALDQWNYGTPLIFAASEGRMEIAKLLIERGADLNALGKNGWTALGCAAAEGHVEMVDLLIGKGADIERAVEGLRTMAEWSRGAGVNNDKKMGQGMSLIQGRVGTAYFSSGQYEKAAAFYRTRAQANPQNADNLIGLAFSDNALRKYGEAKAAAEAALKLVPDSLNALQALADSLSGVGDYKGAVEPLKKAVTLDPKNPWPYFRLGNAYVGLASYPEAIANLRKASELAPDEIVPLRDLANACARAGSFDDAIAAAGALLGKLPPKDSVDALGLRSFLYREKGLPDEAAKDAEKAGSIDAAHPWSHLTRGTLALDRGEYDEALRELGAIKDPDFVLAAVLQATAFARKGDLDQAASTFGPVARSVAGSSNAFIVRNARILLDLLKPAVQARLDKAAALEGASGYREALGEYASALPIADPDASKGIMSRAAALLKAHPDLAELPEAARKFSLRGEVLLKEKDLAGALGEYTSALGLAPFCPVLRYNAAMISAELGRYSLAVVHMNTYLELAPEAANAREAKDQVYKWEFMIERGADKK